MLACAQNLSAFDLGSFGAKSEVGKDPGKIEGKATQISNREILTTSKHNSQEETCQIPQARREIPEQCL